MNTIKIRNLNIKIISFFLIASLSNAQTDSLTVDSLSQKSVSLKEPVTKKQNLKSEYHSFDDLILTPFNGFADILRDNNDVQIFDFMELGRPRFVAPLNMFPHQQSIIIDGVRMNDHVNGMYNTRFISLDHVSTIRSNSTDSTFKIHDGAGNSLYIKRRYIDQEEAYTRLKFYEGDFQYSDLDIFFANRYSENLNIQLYGFNKGYEGSGFNNAHTGVNYNAEVSYKINKSVEGLFTFRLNHERAGMQNIKIDFTDYTYAGNDVEYGARFYFSPDSFMKDPFVAGFISRNGRHENKGRGSFHVKDRSDDYFFFLQKKTNYKRHHITTTFNIDHHRIWGSAFDDQFSDTRFALDFKDDFKINKKQILSLLTDVEVMNDFSPHLNASISWKTFYSSFATKLSAMMQNRYPAPLERAYNYQQYSGNSNLSSENVTDVSLTQSWLPFTNLQLEGTIGLSQINNEIQFRNSTFQNGSERNWSYIKARGITQVGPFRFSAGGRVLNADQYLSPKEAAWTQLSYHDIWFNGVIIIDIGGHVNWFGEHDQILYNPIVQRFYTGNAKNSAYTIAGIKIALTVSDAELFLEMDNLLEEKMVVIDGYDNDLRQVRFGVNWVMWN